MEACGPVLARAWAGDLLATPTLNARTGMDWDERNEYAARAFIPWIEKSHPLTDALVVEFGCGNGAVSCAVGGAARQLIGVDIDAAAVVEGRSHAKARGQSNIELSAGRFEELEERVRALTGDVDVFLLFATLEHMTIAERLDVLGLAREVVADDGCIVVCESPNRLLPWDHHTSQLPFFGMLPDELALCYSSRSPRQDFTQEVAAALQESPSAGLEKLIRWGRGVSFHEFERVFDDFPANVIACNYEPELLDDREVHREELALARFLKRTRPDIPPSFSRYWLDLIIARRPTATPRFTEPWMFETTNSRHVDFTEWDTLLLRGPHARLTAHLGAPAEAVVIGIENRSGPLELRLRSLDGAVRLKEQLGPADGFVEYRTARLDPPARAVTIDASEACHVSFLGFRPAP
jgi:ubiquinone/menaquinone biosynthesis C-methylase UbiE